MLMDLGGEFWGAGRGGGGWRFMKTRGFRFPNPGFRNLRVPTTPHPDTSAKAFGQKLEVYVIQIGGFQPREGHSCARASRHKWELYRNTCSELQTHPNLHSPFE